jgi:hypothetical protein
MTRSGNWTDGIKGDDNWLHNWTEANDFLRAHKANGKLTGGKNRQKETHE